MICETERQILPCELSACTLLCQKQSLPRPWENRFCDLELLSAHNFERQRAKSDADFINKLEGCLQEADETAYWLELLVKSDIVSANKFEPLRKETDEIIAILVTIVTKVKKRIGKI